MLGGVVWAHCLPEGVKAEVAERLSPVLGVLGALAERVLDFVINVWDWLRAKMGGGCLLAGSGSCEVLLA